MWNIRPKGGHAGVGRRTVISIMRSVFVLIVRRGGS